MFFRSIATALLSVSIFAGCASTGLMADSSSSIGSKTVPNLVDAGVVLLPVTDRALFTSTGVSLYVTDESGKQHALIGNMFALPIPSNEGKGMKYYGAFNLPAGSYTFVSWRLIKTEGGPSEAPKEAIGFQVRKGEVIYVGNFNAIRPLAVGQFRDTFEADRLKYQEIFSWLKDKEIKNQPMKSTWWPLPGGKIPN
nr:hypothetical protein [uncultured Rhodoferax sp.]